MDYVEPSKFKENLGFWLNNARLHPHLETSHSPVECASLLMRFSRKGIGGSNPLVSAQNLHAFKTLGIRRLFFAHFLPSKEVLLLNISLGEEGG